MKTMNLKKQKNLKNLMNEYDIEYNTLDYSDEEIKLLQAVQKLSDPDKIILYLYAELQSYRKLAKELNVSFTTAYKSLIQIRNKIQEYYDN